MYKKGSNEKNEWINDRMKTKDEERSEIKNKWKGKNREGIKNG